MSGIEHVFVLMLENRSFDHMLGFAPLRGIDARTGAPTAIEGLTGAETNPLPSGGRVTVTPGADYTLPVDPGHEFDDVLEQLCGRGATYPGPGGTYPPIDSSGFASRMAAHVARLGADVDPGTVLKGFRPEQLPVLNALAAEFAICDHWFCSMPGPTWPNRLFVHAASSAGLDDSPSGLQSAAELIEGHRFEHGTIYDRLVAAELPWHVVEGDALPQCLALGGMLEHVVAGHFMGFDDFLARVREPSFDDAYVFIEPNYGHVLADGRNFKCGNSQHPLDDVTRGERLLKDVYEAIRSSPHWPSSLLVVMYDEHGGFYDHVAPPPATPPGDTPGTGGRHRFRFDRLGVRVPVVLASPLIARGVIDHTVYDHTSLLATVERLYGLDPLTARDAGAAPFDHLLTNAQPRLDAPATLPEPADSGLPDCEEELLAQRIAGDLEEMPDDLSGALEPALVGFLQVAMAREIHLAAAVHRDVARAVDREKDRLQTTLESIHTKFDAVRLLRQVSVRYRRFQESDGG